MKTSLALKAAALCVLLSPNAALAQDPPPEPETDRPGWLKRSIRHLLEDDDSKGDGRGIHLGPLAPRADVLSSGGGPAPVLHFWAPDMFGTAVDLHASAAYSTFKYQYYDVQFGLVPHVDKRLPKIETGTNALFPLSDIEKTSSAPGFNIYVSAKYRDYPREDFYGIGPDTVSAGRAGYRLQDGLYEGVIRMKLSRLSLMGRAGVLQTSILPGKDPGDPQVESVYADRTAPGLFRSPDFNHFSGGAWLELRDQPGNPHRGAAFGIAYSRFDERNGSRHDFNRLTIDAREYIPLGSNRHVIALRQTTSLDQVDEGSTAPFYLRPTLGGSTLLRAYPSFRFRDNRFLLLASEYRFEIHPKFELALIYEAGKVFGDSSGFDLHDLRRGYGAGLRFKSARKVHLRLDAVRGVEGTRVLVKLGPAF